MLMLLPCASPRCYTAARRTNKSSVFKAFLGFVGWLSTLPPQPASFRRSCLARNCARRAGTHNPWCNL
jgi:hypothetical protein